MSDLVSQNLNMIFKTPKGETVHALKDLNFTLKKGELLTVLGPSGCGKTTLLNITAGFIRPTSGSITLNSKEIDGPGVERGMVFQQGALFEWLTVAENVNFGLRMKKEDPIETQKKVDEWLEIVGLKGLTVQSTTELLYQFGTEGLWQQGKIGPVQKYRIRNGQSIIVFHILIELWDKGHEILFDTKNLFLTLQIE